MQTPAGSIIFLKKFKSLNVINFIESMPYKRKTCIAEDIVFLGTILENNKIITVRANIGDISSIKVEFLFYKKNIIWLTCEE